MQPLSQLSDAVITDHIRRLASRDRSNLVQFLEYLSEVDERRLYAPEGFPSLFCFCISVLRLSESESSLRIRACRLLRQHAELKGYLVSGRISLATIRVIARHVNEKNAATIFELVAGKPVRKVEKIVAGFAPKADVPDQIRRLPTQVSTSVSQEAPSAAELPFAGDIVPNPDVVSIATMRKPDKTEYLSDTRISIKFSANENLDAKIRRVKELARKRCPEGNLEELFDMLCEEFLDRYDPERKAKRKEKEKEKLVEETSDPAKKALISGDANKKRYIPQAIKRIVWKRDEGQCTFQTKEGHRCEERRRLEYDHKKAFAQGGSSTDPHNIRLLCRAHNRLLAEYAFGRSFIAGKILDLQVFKEERISSWRFPTRLRRC
ncbi:MAG: HNH endonuclease [Oligoflexales bacterium]